MSETYLHLPPGDNLSNDAIDTLSNVFKHKASSYKFLWTFAILKHIDESDDLVVSFDALCDTMLASAVVPINRFKLNLGFYDRIDNHIKTISNIPAVQRDLIQGNFKSSMVRSELINSTYHEMQAIVPHRWLSPFFAHKKIHNPTRKESRFRNAIIQFASEAFDGESPPPYKLEEKTVVLHPVWRDYLKRNMQIVRCWALWHWTNYLQNRNPNVPAIANKIGFPESRDQWGETKEFWKVIIQTSPQNQHCIYSGAVLDFSNFHLDHYVPWSFIGHNRPWNVVPVTQEANERKGDKLPHNNYFQNFVALQNAALKIWQQSIPRRFKATIEAYQVDLQLTPQQLVDPVKLKESLERTITPMIEIARNNFFDSDWRYR